MRNDWTIEEEQKLERLKLLRVPESQIARQLGRTAISIRKKMEKLNIGRVYSTEYVFRTDENEYRFSNLSDFVRKHKELFDPADTQEPIKRCRAVAGLRWAEIKARTWKGWTFVSREKLESPENQKLPSSKRISD